MNFQYIGIAGYRASTHLFAFVPLVGQLSGLVARLVPPSFRRQSASTSTATRVKSRLVGVLSSQSDTPDLDDSSVQFPAVNALPNSMRIQASLHFIIGPGTTNADHPLTRKLDVKNSQYAGRVTKLEEALCTYFSLLLCYVKVVQADGRGAGAIVTSQESATHVPSRRELLCEMKILKYTCAFLGRTPFCNMWCLERRNSIRLFACGAVPAQADFARTCNFERSIFNMEDRNFNLMQLFFWHVPGLYYSANLQAQKIPLHHLPYFGYLSG
ncbi:hypothetical protein DFS33DRAFT_1454397 [Desarmillaria ectypa]|nr:hypothetical protein DFS33DRAFT_1454397 [Desarmillaria ectypa]